MIDFVKIDKEALTRDVHPTFEELHFNLNKCKVKVSDKIEPPQTAWISIVNDEEVSLGTLGDFSVIIGKAKSRKSFYINIAIATALGNNVVLNNYKGCLPKERNHVLYFDTEQSPYYVQLAIKRVCRLIEISEPNNLHVYGLRPYSPKERLDLVEFAIYSNPQVGFVVIDGIKDLVTSINDEEQATMIASKLLKWTQEKNIHIITVLHQNKSDTNARGHIGTELVNKAETVLSVTKDETNNNISIVKAEQCRNIEPEPFAFEIIDGLPVIVEDFKFGKKSNEDNFDLDKIENYKKYKLLTEIFSYKKEYSYKNLQIQLQLAFKSHFGKELANNNAQKLITFCNMNNWIVQEKIRKPYTLGDFEPSH